MSVKFDTMIEMLGTRGEVIRHMSDLSWLDDESMPASWLYSPDEDPGQYDEPAPSTAAADYASPSPADAEPPAADAEPPAADAEPPAEPPWWLTDEFCGTPEQEYAAW